MEEDLVRQITDARHAYVAPRARDGALTARERVASLVDEGSFVEYGMLAGETTKPDDEVWSDALVCGVAAIDGASVVVASYDATLRHGTQSDRNQRKMAKLMYLAVEHRWPMVILLEGDGARPTDPFPPPPIAVTPQGRFELLDGLAELNGWAPTIAIVNGRCTDGHAVVAMLSDFVIATQDAEFGAEDGTVRSVVDYAKTGDIDIVCGDEEESIAVAQRYVGLYTQDLVAGEPADEAATIADIIPEHRRRPYDMRKVLHAFADKDSVLEFGSTWGRSMLTAFARLKGRSIGIYANQPKSPLAGAIDAAAADKASRFVELCDAYDLPIVTFVDNPGYMVGPKAESEGIARHHARPLLALHHRTVPLYSVQIRKAYGLGPYAMSGWGYVRRVPELRLAWPSVESGGMSLEGAAYLVKRKEIKAAETAEEALAIRDEYAEKMRDSSAGLRAGRSYQFDDVILPHETRDRIAAMLERSPRIRSAAKKHAIDPR